MPYRDELPRTRDVARESGRWGLWALIVGLVAIVVVIVLTLVAGGFGWVTADFRGARDQREKTVANGNYRIGSYDSFYDQCNAIAAIEAKITLAQKDAKSATAPREKQDAQINLRALENTRLELAGKYNSDSSKAGTRALFKGDDLPYRIDLTTTGGTTCS